MINEKHSFGYLEKKFIYIKKIKNKRKKLHYL